MKLSFELETSPFTYALDATGAKLLAGSYDEVALMDTRTGATLQHYDLRLRKRGRGPSTGAVEILAFSPDGQWGLACTGYHSGSYGSHQVVLLELASGSIRRLSSKSTGTDNNVPKDELVVADFSNDGRHLCGFDRKNMWLFATASGSTACSATLPIGFKGRMLRKGGNVFDPNTLSRTICDIAFVGSEEEEQAFAVMDDHIVRIDFRRGESTIVATGATADLRLLGRIRYDEAMRALILLAGTSAPFGQADPPFRICTVRLAADPIRLEAGPELALIGEPVWLSADGSRALSLRKYSKHDGRSGADSGQELLSVDLSSGRHTATTIGDARLIETSADGTRVLLVSRAGYEVVDAASFPA